MAYAMLEYGILNQSPITVVTGEIGAGKTTLIRHFLNKLDDLTTVGLVTNTHQALGELIGWVLLAFDIEHSNLDKASMYRCFNDFLIKEYAGGKRVILIVDEAQNLDESALEEVRLLSNINADKNYVLQLVLVGQPELKHQLKSPSLKQLVQRIAVAHHLRGLSRDETHAYIKHRLAMAGGRADLFTGEAIDDLYSATLGVPRLLNTLADTALVYAFAGQHGEVDRSIVAEVLQDRERAGIYETLRPDDQDTR